MLGNPLVRFREGWGGNPWEAPHLLDATPWLMRRGGLQPTASSRGYTLSPLKRLIPHHLGKAAPWYKRLNLCIGPLTLNSRVAYNLGTFYAHSILHRFRARIDHGALLRPGRSLARSGRPSGSDSSSPCSGYYGRQRSAAVAGDAEYRRLRTHGGRAEAEVRCRSDMAAFAGVSGPIARMEHLGSLQ